jgi:hypothetical protein
VRYTACSVGGRVPGGNEAYACVACAEESGIELVCITFTLCQYLLTDSQ